MRFALADKLHPGHERRADRTHSGQQNTQFPFCCLNLSRLIHYSPSAQSGSCRPINARLSMQPILGFLTPCLPLYKQPPKIGPIPPKQTSNDARSTSDLQTLGSTRQHSAALVVSRFLISRLDHALEPGMFGVE